MRLRHAASRPLIVLLAALLCPALTRAARSAPERPPEQVTLALKWFHQFQFAGYYAAVEKGFYAEEGLEVSIREPANKRLPLEVVMAGEAEYGVSAADLLKARDSGLPIVVLAAIFQHSPIILLSRSDRQIRGPADLAGKTVMVGGNDLPEIQAMLIREGVTLESIRTVAHSWGIEEVVAGTVDAVQCYITDEPYQCHARGIQPAIMRPIDYGIDFYADSLFTTEQELRRHPRRVAAFRRASLKGWEYAMRHPEELIALILKLPGVRERGVTEDLLRYEAAQMEPLIQPTLMEIGHMNRGRWQRMADTYAELGLLRPGLSMEGFLYDSAPLPKVRRMLYLLSGLLVGVLLVGGLAVAWNGQLRRSVRTRTAELRASRAYLKSVLDASNDAVFVHDADTFQVIDVNRRACEMYGFTREQALLSTPRELSQGDPPYGPNEALAWLRKARADGPQVFTWWARRVDGHLFWTEVGIRFTLIGGAGRFVVTIRDISGRKETEEALLRSTQSYEDIYHSVSEAIYIHDEKGVFIDVNRGAEAMYGYTRTELIGKTPADVAAPGRNDLAAIGRIIRKTFADGTPGQFEFWAVRRSGEVFPKDVIVNKGRYFGQDVLITTARDISAMKRAEQERERLQAQLTQAHKMESVGRLAGGVAHDFNNMLGVILGRTEMAMEKLDPELPLFEDLQEIQKAARRSADLTRQLLAYARKQPATPRVLQLNETVEGMLKMLRRLIGEDTELAWLPGAAPWPILVDPVQIDQVLANLCVNARDAIRGVGQVKIETGNASLDPSFCASRDGAEPGDFVWLSVSDNGCGMDAEVMAHLFEPFFTTKEVGLGTGLGLAMVYGIVKQNNGFIEARSTPGQGSSFKVYLPRHHGPTVPLPEGAPAHPATSGHQTILLVEDEPAVLEMCRSILARAGYRILPAATPDEALRLADAHAGEIDLLLTDVVMPGMNGWDLAQRLCARYPTLRKLFMSGYTADVITSRGVEQEGVPFIQKPFSNGDLAAKVRAVLKEPR